MGSAFPTSLHGALLRRVTLKAFVDEPTHKHRGWSSNGRVVTKLVTTGCHSLNEDKLPCSFTLHGSLNTGRGPGCSSFSETLTL